MRHQNHKVDETNCDLFLAMTPPPAYYSGSGERRQLGSLVGLER